MPDRIMRNDYGELEEEQRLSWQALVVQPFIWRLSDGRGCFRYNLGAIRAQAFRQNKAPTTKQLEGYFQEYFDNGLIEKWSDEYDVEWCFIKRYFQDNLYRKRCCNTTAPLPPSLKELMTEDMWREGDEENILKYFYRRKQQSENGDKVFSFHRIKASATKHSGAD